MESQDPKIWEDIETKKELDGDMKKRLNALLEGFNKKFVADKKN